MLLEPGSTCWRRDTSARAALIIDMADYFDAAMAATRKARHTIHFLNWDQWGGAEVHLAVAEGASGRQAGLRFGVSAASVSRWRALERRQGGARPGPLGGDRRSGRIEAHAEAILALVQAERDMTLHELRASLAGGG